MAKRRIGSVDLNTGELLDGVNVWVGRKVASPYGRQWMQVNQDALAEIAADSDIGLQAWRVFAYLNSRLDFENLILVPQTEIAAALRMKQPAVSRAIKLLADKQIILRGPKVGGMSAYQLNPHYGWKGKVENLRQARQKHLQLVEPAEPGKDADARSKPS
jgi:DNA-binding transcriptional ArsR family regulator